MAAPKSAVFSSMFDEVAECEAEDMGQDSDADSAPAAPAPAATVAVAATATPRPKLGLSPVAVDGSWERTPVQRWLPQVLRILQGLESAAWSRDFRLATGCTGIGTAHLALRYLGVPVREVAVADPKEAAFKSSVASGTLADHYYRSVSDWANGAGPLGLGHVGSLRHWCSDCQPGMVSLCSWSKGQGSVDPGRLKPP